MTNTQTPFDILREAQERIREEKAAEARRTEAARRAEIEAAQRQNGEWLYDFLKAMGWTNAAEVVLTDESPYAVARIDNFQLELREIVYHPPQPSPVRCNGLSGEVLEAAMREQAQKMERWYDQRRPDHVKLYVRKSKC